MESRTDYMQGALGNDRLALNARKGRVTISIFDVDLDTPTHPEPKNHDRRIYSWALLNPRPFSSPYRSIKRINRSKSSGVFHT